MLVKNIGPLNHLCFYSNNATSSCITFAPVVSYLNADTKKTAILQDNQNKVGIYR